MTHLFQINNSTPKLNTQNAKLSLDLAKKIIMVDAAVLRGIKDEIIAANLKYKNDSVNYLRQKNLWNQNIGSKVEYDTKKLKYQLASKNATFKSKYDRTKNELETALNKRKTPTSLQ